MTTTLTENELREIRVINYRVKQAANFTCQKCGMASNTLAVDVIVELDGDGGETQAVVCLDCFEAERHIERPGQWRAAELQRAEEKKAPPKKRG